MKNLSRLPIYAVIFLSLAFLYSFPSGAADRQSNSSAAPSSKKAEDNAQIMPSAEMVFNDIMASRKIPRDLVDNSAGIAIFPRLVEAGSVVGARYGEGVLMTRKNNEWSLPVFVSIAGGGIGAPVKSTDLVLVFTNAEDIKKMADGNITFGVDAKVAAGHADAAGAASMQDVGIYAYKRAEENFGGVSLTGSNMYVDRVETLAYYIEPAANTARGYYGNEASDLVDDILSMNNSARLGAIPEGAKKMQEQMNRYSSGKP